MRVIAIAALGLGTALGGCATLTRGTTETVYVVSDPPGAKASVSFSSATCITPCSFDVNRGDAFSVGVEKPGYDAQSVPVKVRSTAPSDATSRDVTADYLGRVVDFQDGANAVHEPNPVKVKLDKTDAPAG